NLMAYTFTPKLRKQQISNFCTLGFSVFDTQLPKTDKLICIRINHHKVTKPLIYLVILQKLSKIFFSFIQIKCALSNHLHDTKITNQLIITVKVSFLEFSKGDFHNSPGASKNNRQGIYYICFS